MGKTANYAVVMAQLYTRGKCEGIHPFLVQLRDENTHEPLPGEFNFCALHSVKTKNAYLFFTLNEKVFWLEKLDPNWE